MQQENASMKLESSENSFLHIKATYAVCPNTRAVLERDMG